MWSRGNSLSSKDITIHQLTSEVSSSSQGMMMMMTMAKSGLRYVVCLLLFLNKLSLKQWHD